MTWEQTKIEAPYDPSVYWKVLVGNTKDRLAIGPNYIMDRSVLELLSHHSTAYDIISDTLKGDEVGGLPVYRSQIQFSAHNNISE